MGILVEKQPLVTPSALNLQKTKHLANNGLQFCFSFKKDYKYPKWKQCYIASCSLLIAKQDIFVVDLLDQFSYVLAMEFAFLFERET